MVGLHRSYGLAATCWDGQAGFEVAAWIHQTPLVLPALGGSVEDDFPRFIESLEPARS